MIASPVNILDVIGSRELKQVAATRGGEWHGPCPFCGGNDRFRVQPETGRWHCRGCSPTSHWQDALDFVMKRDSVSLAQAAEKLGVTVGQRAYVMGEEPVFSPPSHAWQQAAWAAVEESEGVLFSEAGARARAWLRDVRGITEPTMLRARLGFVETPGLVYTGEDGDEVVHLSMPVRGILIPRIGLDKGKDSATLWGLKIATAKAEMKYCLVKGSKTGLCTVWDTNSTDYLFITEGEMDMLVAYEHIGDLCAVATFGGIASKEQADIWKPFVSPFKQVILCTDDDDVGIKANRAWSSYPTTALRPPVHAFPGKDLTDWVKGGWDVEAALEVVLAKHEMTRMMEAVEEEDDEPASPLDCPYTLIDTVEGVNAMLDELQDTEVLACDTETTGLDPLVDHLLLFQVGRLGHTYMVDMQKVPPAALCFFLHAHKFIFQNAKFDLKFLKNQTGVWPRVEADTQLNEQILNAGKPRHLSSASLASLTLKYHGFEMSKSERLSFVGHSGPFTEAQLKYAGRDVQALYYILERQREQLVSAGLQKTARLETLLVTAVADMELAGIGVDEEKWRAFIAEAQAKKDDLQPRITEILGTTKKSGQIALWSEFAWNINSTDQLREGLEGLGLNCGKVDSETNKKPSLDDKALEKMRDKHEVIPLIIDYREAQKLVSSFGDSILKRINPGTRRIHASFNQMATDTGRFSASEPNLQQIPQTSALRACFVPRDGFVFVIADYPQIELRILAHYSQDPGLLEAFANGQDLHTATASTMYKVPFEEVSKELRYKAKSINFGLVYGRGPAALAEQLKVSTEEGKKLVKLYFDSYPGVSSWLRKQGAQACKEGYTRTLLGRRRLLDMPLSGDPEFRKKIGSVRRQGTNSPIQGSSGDMTKMAMGMIFHKYTAKGFPGRVVLCVHDELVMEVQADRAEEAKEILATEMQRAGESLIPSVAVPVTAEIATCWTK